MPASSPLSRVDYKSLLQDIRDFVRKTKTKEADRKLAAYWHIGRRIQQESVSQDVGYYSSVIKDLARDLRISSRTLYDAVQFSEVHDEPPTSPTLSWTHHRILLRLATDKHRRFYERLIEREDLSARALEAAIAEGLHLGKKKPGKSPLPRPTDPEYLYRATVLGVIDADTLDLDIDLGFGVYRRLRARLANIDAPDIASAKGRAARDFVTAQLMGEKTVCVKTVKVDLHGRYVVHLFHLARRASISKCFAEGSYLNEDLLTAKLARVVRG